MVVSVEIGTMELLPQNMIIFINLDITYYLLLQEQPAEVAEIILPTDSTNLMMFYTGLIGKFKNDQINLFFSMEDQWERVQ